MLAAPHYAGTGWRDVMRLTVSGKKAASPAG